MKKSTRKHSVYVGYTGTLASTNRLTFLVCSSAKHISIRLFIASPLVSLNPLPSSDRLWKRIQSMITPSTWRLIAGTLVLVFKWALCTRNQLLIIGILQNHSWQLVGKVNLCQIHLPLTTYHTYPYDSFVCTPF